MKFADHTIWVSLIGLLHSHTYTFYVGVGNSVLVVMLMQSTASQIYIVSLFNPLRENDMLREQRCILVYVHDFFSE
jgi:hypothetical protein